MKLRFAGAAETVTGSRNLIHYRNKTYLVDAGLFQGPKDARHLNWYPDFDPQKIEAIILTHAHIDHSGLIPKLHKDGFRGKIYCTKATYDLCQIMLLDSAHLQEEDARYANKTGYSNHMPAYPLYTVEEAKASLESFFAVELNEWVNLENDLSFRFHRAGHILGSSFVEMNFKNGNDQDRSILFSGDLGNGRSRIIRPPENPVNADFLVIESTYGDRLQSRVDPRVPLAEVINKVAARGGVIIIPAFTIGRTQDVLHLLHILETEGDIPKLPVYVDSPMANSANKIFLKHREEHLIVLEEDKVVSPINPANFHAITDVNDSIALLKKEGPMIILTASGMLTGGRVMHHLKARLPNKRNAVIFVGFQAPHTKGRLLQDGLNSIRIHHEEIPVEAEIFTIDGLSAHADYQDTLEWLMKLKKKPTAIFLNHGEMEAARSLKEKIEKRFQFNCIIPEYMQEFNLDTMGL
ncbi:MAG: MBL fold metallo-hydrolase RNA specificity domain-containing protein [Bacteriovorax sp.]